MKHEVEQFLASDLLENYLMGTTTAQETQRVEHFITTYPEVKSEYIKLQEGLEAYARSFAIEAPKAVKDRVLSAITKNKKRRIPGYGIAASIAVLLFASSTLYFWRANRSLTIENAAISNTIQLLEASMEDTKTRFNTLRDQFAVITDPNTQKYVLTGNEKAATLKTLAYVNPKEKAAYITVLQLPELPEEQCYQMWADVDGEMLSMAILAEKKEALVAIPYEENAVSYNITIEPKGGNDHATVENLVANVLLSP